MLKKALILMLAGLVALSVLSGCMNRKNENNTSDDDGKRVSSAIYEENADEGETLESSETESEAVSESEAAESKLPSNENTGITPHEEEIFYEEGIETTVPEKQEPIIIEEESVTYVNGILIANKTYALPSSYAPGDILDYVYDAFYQLQEGARSDGLNIYISSGYRSYDIQKSLYARYCARDGQAAADTYSARAGHSEHQTGLAMDVNEISNAFIGTPEAIWLQEHAHEYGFIIRYPQGKEDITGYIYEPWHLRYLGVDIATDVYESGLCLEEYLGIDSKYAD